MIPIQNNIQTYLNENPFKGIVYIDEDNEILMSTRDEYSMNTMWTMIQNFKSNQLDNIIRQTRTELKI